MPVDFIAKKGSQLAQSSILKSTQHFNFNTQGIKYIPKQPTSDVGETSVQQLHKIASMRKAGATQVEIAERLGIGRATIQRVLKTHLSGVIPEDKKFLKGVKAYFSAKTPEGKNKAFNAVDPFLQKIAKEKYEMQKNCSYDDCLQDLRLNFVNVTNKNAKNPNLKISKFLYEFKQNALKPTVAPEKPIRIQLSELEKDGSPIAKTDLGIKEFENNDYKFEQIQNSGLSDRERVIANSLTKNKTLEEIGDSLWLTKERVRQIIVDKIVPKMETFKDLPKKPKPLQ